MFSKKLIATFLIASSIFAASFAQELDTAADDDFDSLFDDATEDVVIEEQPAPVVQQAPLQIAASMIKFSGRLDADIGAALYYTDKLHPTGYLDFDNVFRMKVRPANTLALNAAITTYNENRFTMYLSDMYIDYLVFDRVYISAGLKSSETVGGYTRILSESATSDTSGQVNIDVRFPWSTGMVKVLGAYNQKEVAGIEPSAEDITYGVELEQTIGHTSVNLFAKKYGENVETSLDVHKHPSAGLELKRTIFGFDTYIQSVASLANYKKPYAKEGYERVAATAGFYRLWDAQDPNVGINLEYKYVWVPGAETAHNHQIAYEGGIKRLGKNKNFKIGVNGAHNFTTQSGNAKLALLISGIFPYANWTNAVSVDYVKGVSFKPAVASIIAIDLDY